MLRRMLCVLSCAQLLVMPTLAQAANTVGGTCSRIGAITKVGKTSVKCTRVGKKLLWVKVTSGTTTVSTTAPSGTTPSGSSSGSSGNDSLGSQAEIPAVVANWGFNLAPYSAATGMAGDMRIRGVVPPTFSGSNATRDNAVYRMLIDPIALQTVLGKPSPQISFWLPLGTRVISMISGTVCKVEQIYSGDYSIMIASPKHPCINGQAAVSFEHEHVMNPLVTVGQKVSAGETIATVSDYNTHWKAKGLGIVEIGILYGKKNSTSPWHACVASFLDPTKKGEMLAALESAMTAWEAELGDTSIFDERAMPVYGCYSTEEIPA